jgi:hypothetical protein
VPQWQTFLRDTEESDGDNNPLNPLGPVAGGGFTGGEIRGPRHDPRAIPRPSRSEIPRVSADNGRGNIESLIPDPNAHSVFEPYEESECCGVREFLKSIICAIKTYLSRH